MATQEKKTARDFDTGGLELRVGSPKTKGSEIGEFDGVGNNGNGAAVAFELRDRQADSFNANRSLVDGVLLDLGGDFNMQPPVLGIPALRVQDALEFDQLAHAIDVSLDDVAAEAAVGLHGQLQVHHCALVHARE